MSEGNTEKDTTRVDRLIKRAKNNKFIALVIVIGVAIVAFSTLLTSVQSTWRAFGGGTGGLEIVTFRIINDTKAIEVFREEWFTGNLPERDLNWEPRLSISSPPVVGDFPIIDIIVKNDGKSPIVLTKIEFDAQQVERTDGFLSSCSPVAPSWVYNVLLNDISTQKKKVDLAQSVLPGEVDRFSVVVGADLFSSEAVYEITPTIVAGKDSKINIEKFRLSMKGNQCGGAGPQLLKPFILGVPES